MLSLTLKEGNARLLCHCNQITRCTWTVIQTTQVTTYYLFKEPTFQYARPLWMRVLSTAVLICSGIWKVYNAGNGFWENSKLLQQKWLFIPMFCRVVGQIQMKKECSYRLRFPGHSLKAFRTNFKKGWQLHTCSCALNPKVQLVSPKVTKTTEAVLLKMKKIWLLNTQILRYYNNYHTLKTAELMKTLLCQWRTRTVHIGLSTLKGQVWSEALVNYWVIQWQLGILILPFPSFWISDIET